MTLSQMHVIYVCLGVFRALRTIYHKEGALGYYRGNVEDHKICFIFDFIRVFFTPSCKLLISEA